MKSPLKGKKKWGKNPICWKYAIGKQHMQNEGC